MPVEKRWLALGFAAVVFGCGGAPDARLEEASRLSGRPGDPRAVERLRRLTADADARVRAVALAALVDAAPDTAGEEILAALRDEGAAVRAVAANAAGARAVPGAGEILPALARGDPSEDVRRHAVAALVLYPGPRADEALRAAVDDPVETIRAEAIRRLGPEASRSAMAVLAARALGDVSWEVRVEAVLALARGGIPAAWVPVDAARLDGSEFVRAAADAAAKDLVARGIPRSEPEEEAAPAPAPVPEPLYTPPSVPDTGGSTDGPPDSP